MESCFIRLVLMLWYSFHILKCKSEQPSESGSPDDCLTCISHDMSHNSSRQTFIPLASEQHIEQNLDIGEALNLTCTWTSERRGTEYQWKMKAPDGWRILLRVTSSRIFKIEVGNVNTGGSENASFSTVEDPPFLHGVDEFISITNMIWIQVTLNGNYCNGKSCDDVSETLDIITRTVKVNDAVDTEQDDCEFSREGDWNINGYRGFTDSKGSLIILCNWAFVQQSGILLSFSYSVELNFDSRSFGSLQFVYVSKRNLVINPLRNLFTSISFQNNSFTVQFDASGSMRFNISSVKIQSLVYYDGGTEQTSTPGQSSSSSSQSVYVTSPTTSLSPISATVSTSSTIPAALKSSTTVESETSFTSANMTTESSMPRLEAQSTPSFLIPTVSMVVIFLLVSIAVLFICWKKRYRKRQSGNGDSVLSEDDERHEYCDVLPSGKPSSNETTYDFADPSSAENGSGIKNASKDERTANDKPNSHSADESESPYAENGVLVKGQGYVMVDMGKKASQHQEKPKTLDNTGNDLDKDDHGIDEVKRSPTKNEVIVNGPEYAVVDMEKKASQRKEKAKISLNRGKDHPKGDHCMDQGEGSTEKPKVFKNGQEYAVVDMEKKALERKGKSKMGRSDEKRLESNDDETYFTLEPDASPEDKDGQTNQMNVKSSSGKDTADIHKTPKGESDYDEPQPFGSSSAEQYDELQFNPSVSDLSKKSDNQAKGESTDDAAEAYQTVSASTSPVSSVRPDSYPPSDYEAMSPPTSPGVMLTGTDGQYPSSDNKTGGSLSAAAVEPVHRPLDTYQLVVQDQTSGNRDSSASHTYEDPAVMAEALERPYDKLQRGSDRNKPLATQKTISAADKEVAAMANHEDALNVYDEIATANVTIKEADESSGAYQHLQRPLTKRSKAREPLPAIPGDEGYGRLNLEDNGASSHTNAAAHEERESGDSANKDDGPTYATVENPSEAYRPDDDDPAYDLLGTLK